MRGRQGDKYAKVRSIRVDDELWNTARRRATEDGRTISSAINLLLQAYGERLLQLPETKLIITEK